GFEADLCRATVASARPRRPGRIAKLTLLAKGWFMPPLRPSPRFPPACSMFLWILFGEAPDSALTEAEHAVLTALQIEVGFELSPEAEVPAAIVAYDPGLGSRILGDAQPDCTAERTLNLVVQVCLCHGGVLRPRRPAIKSPAPHLRNRAAHDVAL